MRDSLPSLLDKTLKKYTGEGIPLTGQLAEMMATAEAAGTVDISDDSGQRLLSEWMYETPSKPEPESSTESGEDEELEDDAKELKTMVDDELLRMYWRLKRMGITIKLWGDGGYDARRVFALLVALDIIPIIRVRINSIADDADDADSESRAPRPCGPSTDRRTGQLHQQGIEPHGEEGAFGQPAGLEGLRWIVEIVISAFKRVFGESIRALTPGTTNIEIATKIAAYNENLDIGDKEVRRMRFEYQTGRLPGGQTQLRGAVA